MKSSLFQKIFVSLQREKCLAKACTIILQKPRQMQITYWNLKLTRFCLVYLNLENSINVQDGVRRFTYIYVGLSSHSLYITAFQSLGTEIMGYASPLFVSLRQLKIEIRICHLRRSHHPQPCRLHGIST